MIQKKKRKDKEVERLITITGSLHIVSKKYHTVTNKSVLIQKIHIKRKK
jgi:hypothetical protein